MTSPTPEDHLAVALHRARPWLLALTVFLLLTHIEWWWNGTGDEPSYLSIAKSIAGGQLGRFGEAQMRFSPGYPALIAPLFWISDRPFLLINLLNAALLLSALAPMTRWLGLHAGRAGVLLCAMVVVNLSVWYYTRRPLSEAAFVPLYLLAGLALQRLADARRIADVWRLAAVIGPFIGFVALVRQIGVWLVPAFGVVLLIRLIQRRVTFVGALVRGLLVGVPSAGLVVALALYERAARDAGGADTGYMQHLLSTETSILERVALCAHLRVSEVGRLFVPGMRTTYADEGDWLDVNTFVFLAVAGVLAWGWVVMVRRRADVLLLSVPFYLGFLLFWPYEAATRYAAPLLPVLALSLWGVLRGLPRHRLSIVAVLTAAHLGVTLVHWAMNLGTAATADQWRAAEAAAAVIDEPSRLAAVGIETPLANRVGYILDRPVIEARSPDDVPVGVRWLLLNASAPVPEGWEDLGVFNGSAGGDAAGPGAAFRVARRPTKGSG